MFRKGALGTGVLQKAVHQLGAPAQVALGMAVKATDAQATQQSVGRLVARDMAVKATDAHPQVALLTRVPSALLMAVKGTVALAAMAAIHMDVSRTLKAVTDMGVMADMDAKDTAALRRAVLDTDVHQLAVTRRDALATKRRTGVLQKGVLHMGAPRDTTTTTTVTAKLVIPPQFGCFRLWPTQSAL